MLPKEGGPYPGLLRLAGGEAGQEVPVDPLPAVDEDID